MFLADHAPAQHLTYATYDWHVQTLNAWQSAQLEIWTNSSTVLLSAYLPLGGSLREPLTGAAGLPPGSFDYYVQFVSLLAQPLGLPCSSGLDLAASPAMVFGY